MLSESFFLSPEVSSTETTSSLVDEEEGEVDLEDVLNLSPLKVEKEGVDERGSEVE